MTEQDAASPMGEDPDYNPEAVITRLREQLASMREEAAHEARIAEQWSQEAGRLERELSDERHDHGTTKRLLSDQINKRWKLQDALEKVAATKSTKGRLFCHYCNQYTEDGHRDYCVVGPVLDAVKRQPPCEEEVEKEATR